MLLFILKIGSVIKLLFGLDIIHPVKKLTLYSLYVWYTLMNKFLNSEKMS